MTRKYENNKKLGFTLFEVVVTMGIVAIFIAACSNVFTAQHKNRTATPPHGRVECYWTNTGKLNQRTYYENVLAGDVDRTADGKCIFAPTRDVSYVIVSAVGGGGKGGATLGGSAGEFLNMFLPSTTHHLELIPGKGAVVGGNDAERTVVNDIGQDGNDNPKSILRVAPGANDIYSTSTGSVALGDCAVTFNQFSCGLSDYCEALNDVRKIRLHRCTSNTNPGDNPYEYFDDNVYIDYTTANGEGGILDNVDTNDPNFADGLIMYDKQLDTTNMCGGYGYNRDMLLLSR